MRSLRELIRASLWAEFNLLVKFRYMVGKRLAGRGEARPLEESQTGAESRREAQEPISVPTFDPTKLSSLCGDLEAHAKQGSRDEAGEIFDDLSAEIEAVHEQMAALRFGVGNA